MIYRIGVDLVEIKRLEGVILRHGARFLDRVFTQQEQSDASGKVESLAARFAAKEAVAKALGCGIGKVGWLDIEVLSAESRQPHIELHGEALREAERLKLTHWSVSLSHTHELAIAMIIAAQ